MARQKNTKPLGFTLLELSVVLTLIAFITGGGLVVFTANIQSNQFNTTVAKMDAIEKALYNFSVANNRIPCPSNLTLTQNSTDYGLEAGADASSTIAVGTGTCTGTGMVPQVNFSSSNSAEGGVPTRALKLADSFMYDAWGRHFRYAVDSGMTFTGAMHSSLGACGGFSPVTINDSTGAFRSNAAIYALISHGANGHGAYSSGGAIVNAGSSSANELINCHCNSSGSAGTYAATYVQKAPQFDSGQSGVSNYYFDDIVTYKENWQMQSPWDKTTSCPSSQIWVVDGNDYIDEFSSGGVYQNVTINFHGNSPQPEALAFDSGGNIWTAAQSALEKCTTAGSCTNYTSHITNVYGVAIVSGSNNVWVSDITNNQLYEYNSGGVYQGAFGTAGGSGNGGLNIPKGLAIDSGGNIWVADAGNNRIDEFTSAGAAALNFSSGTTNYFGSIGTGVGQFNYPVAIAVDSSGNLWIADDNNARIQKCTNAGVCVAYGTSQLTHPYGIAIDSSDNVWVTDGSNNKVYVYNNNGVYQTSWGTYGTTAGKLNAPLGLAITSR